MPTATFTDEVRGLLGPNLERLESASLRHGKLTFLGDDSKREQLEAVCQAAVRHRISPPLLPSDVAFTLTLGGRMMVNMAGGVLENAGLCLHPFFNCPMIPGSALKGVARHQAWVEWREAPDEKRAKATAADIVQVFGYPTADRELDAASGHDEATQGQVMFLPAFPANENWTVVVDVLTPHGGNDYTNPVPSFFLAVDRGAEFRFGLKAVAQARPELLQRAESWLKRALCEHGVGAKTVAGYGWFAQTQRQTIPLRLMTPGFFGGASHGCKDDTTLRVASLRGLMRWWWRTLYRDLLPSRTLQQLEQVLWGSTTTGASLVLLRLVQERGVRVHLYDFKDRFTPRLDFAQAHDLQRPPRGSTQGLFYLSYGMDEMIRGQPKRRFFVEAGAEWDLEVSARDGRGGFTMEVEGMRGPRSVEAEAVLDQARAAISLLCRYGGIGSKSRKGFGSVVWADAWDLDRCRRTAMEFCQRLGLNSESRPQPYSFADALTEELLVRWTDPWTVLDRLGAAVQGFAQRYKHSAEKAVLGLPRKIHGPRAEPMDHQRRESHQRPTVLQPALPAAKSRNENQVRFAAPVFYHVAPTQRGTLIRITAFPSGMLGDATTSRRLLAELLSEVKDTLAQLDSAVSAPVEFRPSRPATHREASPPVNEMRGGIRAGARVTGRLLEEKTKKGGWRAEVQGHVGPIVNSPSVPADKKAGDSVILIVQSASSTSPLFRWPDGA